tara:strand:+ start:390 stop:509 length:120 start_codon:yes stop_codon:yes gene_type:complete
VVVEQVEHVQLEHQELPIQVEEVEEHMQTHKQVEQVDQE